MSEQKNREKQWNLLFSGEDPQQNAAVERLCREMGISKTMARLLCVRGYNDAAAVTSFLHQDELSLHDPYLLQDAKAAVERVLQAVEDGERIAIYGDYDVDGVTSVSLLYLYLTALGADVGYYIPSREREGYGVSCAAIDRLKEKGVSLMITVDTGITANAETEYAKSLGIDTVVTDHHECRAELPSACAVVNPHRADDSYPFKELAGVGVVFKLICAIEVALCRQNGTDELDGVRRICREYADLVAIGTVADVMPLADENRLIVTYGLHLLEKTARPGLRALIDAARNTGNGKSSKTRKINSGFIGFVIAPRMNAAGRVGEATDAVELILAESAERAAILAEKLCDLNHQRQVEENRIAEQAYKKIEETLDEKNNRVIVISDDSWKQGIIGIVSSRITERYGLPSILLSFDGSTRGFPAGDDQGKGSGRSVKGLNLVEALMHCEDLLVRFGGHELAAGLTVQRCNVDAFRDRINQYAKAQMPSGSPCVTLDADCEVGMSDLTMKLAEEIALLEPFGVSNAVPNLVLSGATVERILPMGEGRHTKLIVEKDGRQMSAVWFNVSTALLELEVGDRIDLLFQLNVNEYQGNVSLQMLVQDVRLSGDFQREYLAQKQRYEEIRGGESFSEEEGILPTRDDLAAVYTMLRHEFRMGHTVFPIRRILGMLAEAGYGKMHYAKLKFILRIMQELQICDVNESAEDRYVFEFYFQSNKTNIEKSTILHRLRSQQRR